ncbi:hypothetical protein DL96DRAFT_1610198 [Flagelloscypha sp. PMI_526]|nr:hypothetical protein DL96DRAFT_1610198 [Flagelloscypha sp. PMI_526]
MDSSTFLVNSQLLQVSRDELYSKLFIAGGVHLARMLPALRNPEVAGRLAWVALDPTYSYPERSDVEEFVDILRASQISHLDLVEFHEGFNHSILWMKELIRPFVQLPQLQYLKLQLVLLPESDILTALQVPALRDLDTSDHRLSSIIQTPLSNAGAISPILHTLRIHGACMNWRKLIGVVDFSHLKRLALWDVHREMEDLTNDWGGLVTWSALTLESLSLRPTPNIIWQDIPKYLRSAHGFPALRTFSLFHDVYHEGEWNDIILPIIAAFHAFSPSLRHLRLRVRSWIDQCDHEMLLRSEVFADFASAVKGLQNLETILFLFRSSSRSSDRANNEELTLLREMFYPVHLFQDYGKGPQEDAWPFYRDDLPPNVKLPF